MCPRKNCRETLSDVRALACHLSLHDIEKSKCVANANNPPSSIDFDNRTYYCSDCDRGFDRRHALNAHTCLSRCRSAPSSPVFGAFVSTSFYSTEAHLFPFQLRFTTFLLGSLLDEIMTNYSIYFMLPYNRFCIVLIIPLLSSPHHTLYP